jgi:hypothetical protein
MFASLQSPDSRWIEAYGCLDGAWLPMERPGEKRAQQQLRAMPSANGLEALVQKLADEQYCMRVRLVPSANRTPSCINEGSTVAVLTRASDQRASCEARRLSGVRVTVYQSTFEVTSSADVRLNRQRLFRRQTGACMAELGTRAP